MKALAILAVLGLLGSVLWHILALIGRVNRFGIPVLILVVGVFIVLIPAVIAGLKRARTVGRAEPWRAMLGGRAKWAEPLLSGALLYVVVVSVVMQRTNYLSWLGPASRTHVMLSGGWLVCYLIAAVLLIPKLGLGSTSGAAEEAGLQ